MRIRHRRNDHEAAFDLFNFHAAGFNLGKIENVVDDGEEVFAAFTEGQR